MSEFDNATTPTTAEPPTQIVWAGYRYALVGPEGTAVAPAPRAAGTPGFEGAPEGLRRGDAEGVRRAFASAVLGRLRAGCALSLAEIASVKGCAVKTVRKDVDGLLIRTGRKAARQGAKIMITPRSAALYLGYEVEAARLAAA